MFDRKCKISAMMRSLMCFLIMLFASVNLYSQNIFVLEGSVVDNNGLEIYGAHIVNRNMSIGKTSNFEGNFSILVNVGDSVLFTHIGYKPVWYSVPEESSVGNRVRVSLVSDTIYLSETVVRPFPSSFNEFKEMVSKLELPKEEIPAVFDALVGPIYIPQGGVVMPGPISVLYALFSKESKQIRKMNEINHFESVRGLLFSKVSKDVFYKNFGIQSELELECFLYHCGLSEEFIIRASAIEILEQLSLCYALIQTEIKK